MILFQGARVLSNRVSEGPLPQWTQGPCGPVWPGNSYIGKNDLESLILLPLPSECWDYRHTSRPGLCAAGWIQSPLHSSRRNHSPRPLLGVYGGCVFFPCPACIQVFIFVQLGLGRECRPLPREDSGGSGKFSTARCVPCVLDRGKCKGPRAGMKTCSMLENLQRGLGG